MREQLHGEIAALIDRLADGSRDDAARDALLDRVIAWQRGRVAPFGRLREGRALPTDVFRHARIAAHPPEDDVRVFRTSGTTHGTRGEHALKDLSLYDRAAYAAAHHALFRAGTPRRLVMLAPPPDEAPDSSLSYMLGRFAEWFATETVWAFADGRLGLDALARALDTDAPVGVLGTSFALVHAEDGLGDRRFALADQSLVMQTGGYKGRSREVAPDALRAALAARYGVPERRVVSEYGMTELSSQMYEDTILARALDAPRRYWVPGWVRARAVDPDTLAPLPDGALGVLRIDDLANLDSVAAIQTADLGVVDGDRLTLIGRAPGATPRGCSLAIEEALS